MNQSAVLEITRQGLTTCFMVSMPILAVALFFGLIVSVFQAVTQVQEMTLSYVPKIVGVGAVIVMMGGWMLNTLVEFMTLSFSQAGRVGLY